jgi:ribosomal protein S17|nr:MAG TPA: mindbomb E3 ubiquitin protein ligase [Caudoviricetes sp.]
MSNEIKLGDIVVFKTGNRAFEVIGKYIVPDGRLWRVDAITENDPPTPDRNRKYRLVAVDCPNVMLDEIPEIYVESYSEKLERELEERRKEALKMNRNEIKQGDTVRVSKDAPRVYQKGSIFDYTEHQSTVHEVDGDAAIIGLDIEDSPIYSAPIAIPTKYLVKVDAEAKEAKFKAGDRVRFKNIYELQKVKDKSFRWMLVMFASKEATITAVEDNGFYRVDIDPSIGGINDDMIERKIEPTEQTESEKPNHTIKIPVEVDLTDSYWDAYAADLAKEVALKIVNKKMDNRPKDIGAYAVSVAKAVVEGLKRK